MDVSERAVFEVRDLGSMGYERARAIQDEACAEVMAWRERAEASPGPGNAPPAGVILTVEHDSVITVSKRPGVAEHVLGSSGALAAAGVRVVPTDRGGDVTYHGPGQQVVYPIVDLNRLGLRIHGYMRRLERAVIEAVGAHGIVGRRDPDATGVWVDQPDPGDPGDPGDTGGRDGPELGGPAKICAMGVRVRRWVTLHGLALNVDPDLGHFGLINPCGLDRPVTSMRRLLGDRCPPMEAVRATLADRLIAVLAEADRDVPGGAGSGGDEPDQPPAGSVP